MYRRSSEYVFVLSDESNYEEIVVGDEKVGSLGNFFSPDLEVTLYFYQKGVVSVELPKLVKLKVAKVVQEVSSRQQRVLLENQSELNCPKFVNVGEYIWVSTADNIYIKREKEKEKS